MTANDALRQRQQLDRLQVAIQDEAMMTAIKEAQSEVRRLSCWQWALQAFPIQQNNNSSNVVSDVVVVQQSESQAGPRHYQNQRPAPSPCWSRTVWGFTTQRIT
jgi:hypothetical protein